jgi:hypothetical protein
MNIIEKLIRKFFSKKKTETPKVGGKTITEVIEKSLDEKKQKIVDQLDDTEHIEVDVVGTPKMKSKPKKNKTKKVKNEKK